MPQLLGFPHTTHGALVLLRQPCPAPQLTGARPPELGSGLKVSTHRSLSLSVHRSLVSKITIRAKLLYLGLGDLNSNPLSASDVGQITYPF